MEEEESFTEMFFVVLCVIFLSLLVLFLYNKVPMLERFPECIIAILLGVFLGLYIRFFSSHHDLIHFDSRSYYLLLLPPIMFQLGFSMNAPTFFRNIMTINAFAVGGTILSSLLFGTILFYALQLTELQYRFME